MKQEVYAVDHVKFRVNWLSNTIRIPRFQNVLTVLSFISALILILIKGIKKHLMAFAEVIYPLFMKRASLNKRRID